MTISMHKPLHHQEGFTLIELLIVVAILGVIAAIAIPSYRGYIERGHRADMMSELQNIGTTIQSRKLAKGKYSNDLLTDSSGNALAGNFPREGKALYTITIAPDPLTPQWMISATPILGTRMAGDGTLTFNHEGVRCRAGKCGLGTEWR